MVDASIKSVTAEDGFNTHSYNGQVTEMDVEKRINERAWKKLYAKYVNGLWMYKEADNDEIEQEVEDLNK